MLEFCQEIGEKVFEKLIVYDIKKGVMRKLITPLKMCLVPPVF